VVPTVQNATGAGSISGLPRSPTKRRDGRVSVVSLVTTGSEARDCTTRRKAVPPVTSRWTGNDIERVLAGDASAGERAALDRWIGTDKRRRAMVARLVTAANGMARSR